MLKITEFKKEDIKEMLSWMTKKEELISWAGNQFSFPLDSVELQKYFRTFKDKPKAFNIELDGQKMGHCELANINTIEKDVGFIAKTFLRKEYRQKGYSFIAMTELLNYGFSFLDRIILVVIENNEPAIKCYEKLGFEVCKGKGKFF